MRIARGQIAAQRFAALLQIVHFGASLRRACMKAICVNRFLRKIQIEAVGEIEQLLFVQLLLLVGDVLAFAGFAQAVAFDGLGQDDGGLTLVLRARA